MNLGLPMRSFEIGQWVEIAKIDHPWKGMQFQVSEIRSEMEGDKVITRYLVSYGKRTALLLTHELRPLFQ